MNESQDFLLFNHFHFLFILNLREFIVPYLSIFHLFLLSLLQYPLTLLFVNYLTLVYLVECVNSHIPFLFDYLPFWYVLIKRRFWFWNVAKFYGIRNWCKIRIEILRKIWEYLNKNEDIHLICFQIGSFGT